MAIPPNRFGVSPEYVFSTKNASTSDTSLPSECNAMSAMPPIEPMFLDTRDAATLTGYSVKALEIMRVHRKGPKYYRPEGCKKIRYEKSELIAWIKAGCPK